MSDRGKKRKNRKSPFDLGPFDEMFERIWDDLVDMLEGFRPMNEKEAPIEDFNPFVWGVRFNIGSDGKPSFDKFGNTPQRDLRGVRPSINREPLVDVIDEGDLLRVIAEVPGVSKDQINLSSTEKKLLIEAKSDSRHYYKELDLPKEIIPEDAKARFKNGVLDVTFKKKSRNSKDNYKKLSVEET